MGRHWTVIGYLFHGSSLRIVPITAMLQGVLWLRSATEGFCSWPPKFSKCPTFFDLLFCLNNNFQTKKFDALRRSFDWKLISPIMSKDTLRNIFSFYMCMSQIFSYCSVSFWGNFTKSLFVQSRPILMGRLWTNLVAFIWQKHMRNETVVFTFGKENCGGLSLQFWSHVLVRGINFI